MDKQNYFGMYLGQSLYQETETQSIEWSYWTNQKGINDIEKVWITEKGRGAVKFKNSGRFGGSVKIEDCKLILRPLSDMTEEEAGNLYKLRNNLTIEGIIIDSSIEKHKLIINHRYIYEVKEYGNRVEIDVSRLSCKEFEYLLEKGFDIFDLKSKGWAVYESDLKGEKK